MCTCSPTSEVSPVPFFWWFFFPLLLAGESAPAKASQTSQIKKKGSVLSGSVRGEVYVRTVAGFHAPGGGEMNANLIGGREHAKLWLTRQLRLAY